MIDLKYLGFPKKIFFFLLFLTITIHAHGQTSFNLKFEEIGIKDGLPHSTVFGITQDQKGYMWFGTRNGVVRFDGKKMKIFQNIKNNKNSLSYNDSGGVIEDKKGNIWIRTWGGGINKFDPKSGNFEIYKHEQGNEKTLASNKIQYIFQDRKGNILAGTFDAGLSIFDYQTKNFKTFKHDPKSKSSLTNNRVWSVIDDNKGFIWVGTENGLNRLNPKTGEVKRFIHDPEDKKSIRDNQIRMLTPAKNNKIWVATSRGMDLFNPETGKTEEFIKDQSKLKDLNKLTINYILEDNKDSIWIATMEKGLFRINLQTQEINNFIHKPYFNGSITHNDVRYIYMDKAQNLWFATRGGGVLKLEQNKIPFKYIVSEIQSSSLIPDDNIHAVQFDEDENLWIGSWYGGLSKYDFKNKTLHKYLKTSSNTKGLKSKDINALLHLEKEKLIFIGTWGNGLHIFNEKTGEFLPLDKIAKNYAGHDKRDVTSIAADDKGNIWSGSSRKTGIYKYNLYSKKIKIYNQYSTDSYNYSNFLVDSIYYDKFTEKLYAGSDKNLLFFDDKSDSFKKLKDCKEPPFINSSITTMNSSKKHGLIIGTYGDGLFQLKNGKISELAGNKRSVNIINSIIKDNKNRLIIVTANSLCFLNDHGDIYYQADFNSDFLNNSWAIDKKNNIYIGSKHGLVLFNPDEINFSPKKGNILITGFYLFNKEVKQNIKYNNKIVLNSPIEETNKIDLSHNQNFFSISFSETSYQTNANNHIKYKLKGHDRDWIKADANGLISYSRIPPGKYEFVISNQRETKQKRLSIFVKPPIWKKPEIIWPLVIASILVFLFLNTKRLKQVKRRNEKLEKLVAIRTTQIEKQNRRLKILALTDPLTKLLNRRGFTEKLENERIRYKRYKEPFSLIICDIDHFKRINDEFGHDYGDYVIKEVSSILRKNIREQDHLGRWGGEEYILLLPATKLSGAVTLAEKLREFIETHTFFKNDIKVKLTMTFGVAEISPEMLGKDLIALADDALYKGKKSSRNCVISL